MMTYGLEIECGGLRTEEQLAEVVGGVRGVRYGGHFRYKGGNARYGLRAEENGQGDLWISENDISLSGMVGPISRGHEVISPVLKGVEGLTKARMVMKALKRAGCVVNKQTALHVHTGIRNTSARFRRMGKGRQAQAIGRIVDAYDYFMDAGFNSLVSESRRPWSPSRTTYAQPIDFPRATPQSFGTRSQTDAKGLLLRGIGRGVLHLGNFNQYGSIEFRQHNGTLNGHKITNWALLVGRLVSWAITDAHPNFAKDLRNFSPDLNGLMELLNLGTELRRDLTARASQTTGWMPDNRYAQAYMDFQQGLAGTEYLGGWIATGVEA